MPKMNFVISDTHCGSDRGVFPPSISLPPLMADELNRVVKYTNGQKKMFDHLMYCAKCIKKNYKGYQKIIIHNGDAIEGIHHRTIQLSAPMASDHALIHQQVMETFLHEAGFSIKNGDELYYGSGTETHTGFSEYGIAKYFEPYGAKYFDELKINQYGNNIWFVHQWRASGDGVNEGNPVMAGLKSMYFNSLKEGWKMPELVVGSHYHKATLGSYSQNWKTYLGMITPSFQMKTRFGLKVSAFQRNDIGISVFETSENGLLKVHEPYLW